MANATVGDVDTPEPTQHASTWPRDSRTAPEATGIDLDFLFILHKGNLAVIHEAQAVLADAVQEIVRVQCGYVEQFLADAKAALLGQEAVQPGATLVRRRLDRQGGGRACRGSPATGRRSAEQVGARQPGRGPAARQVTAKRPTSIGAQQLMSVEPAAAAQLDLAQRLDAPAAGEGGGGGGGNGDLARCRQLLQP